MKYITFLIFSILSLSAFALDAKDILGINDVDLSSLSVEECISSYSIVTNSPKKCSAIAYILYGSAKDKSASPEANLFEYKDRKVSDETLFQSKKFLIDVSTFHTNKSTRAMASMAIAFAFPNDEEIGPSRPSVTRHKVRTNYILFF